jgi:hypothetical protein
MVLENIRPLDEQDYGTGGSRTIDDDAAKAIDYKN